MAIFSIKTATGNKQTPPRGPPPVPNANGLPKSTPSSTDDMNSALLKSPSDSNDVGNGLFGKFKGFTLRPLNDATSPTNNFTGPNVAYVQPTLQENVVLPPQRAAPPPPIKASPDKPMNGTLARKAPAPPQGAPALPPPNPGSTARPIISMPVLETSTLGEISPTRSTAGTAQPIKPAPPPPVPLHADPKLNIKRDGTIRRITSFLKKDEKPPVKEKTYMDREKLKNLEISAPIPMATPQGESSNSDSETLSPKEEETKNLVKRAQSMRSPGKKPNIQSFGSMRQTAAAAAASRPRSAVSSQTLNSAARPKSPPPRPPPLKKAISTTSSGYQLPITGRSTDLHTYDDCEYVEQPLTSVTEHELSTVAVNRESDNIYSVIDEIPPAAQTLKRSDLVGDAADNSARNSVASTMDLGLLGEIVNEIEKRNGGDSIYSATANTLKKTVKPKEEAKAKASEQQTENSMVSNKARPASTASGSYIRPTAVNAPIARVAPTRSDLSPTTAFSSFKPPPALAANQRINTSAASAATVAAKAKSFNTNTTVTNSAAKAAVHKPLPKTTTAATTTAAPKTNLSNNKPAATIQKPKPLSAKPSFNTTAAKKPTVAPVVGGSALAASKAAATATSTKPVTTTVASLTQKFEPSKAKSPNGLSTSASLKK